MKTKLFFTALVIISFTGIASAQNRGAVRNQSCTGTPVGTYVDANNDGVCDNFVAGRTPGTTGKHYGTATRSSQSNQSYAAKRLRFVDANKNGICDYNEAVVK